MSKIINDFEEHREKLVNVSADFLEYIKTHNKEENIAYANRIRNDFRYVWSLNTYHLEQASQIKEEMMKLLLEYKYFVEGRKW